MLILNFNDIDLQIERKLKQINCRYASFLLIYFNIYFIIYNYTWVLFVHFYNYKKKNDGNRIAEQSWLKVVFDKNLSTILEQIDLVSNFKMTT